MKNYPLAIIVSFILFAAVQDFAFCRQSSPGITKEKVVLFTDRAIYIAGEQIHFNGTLLNETHSESTGISQILYCELITPDGTKVAGNKYLLRNSSAAGCLSIPGDLLTGVYYLRAYSKQMRNYGTASYEYKQIRIINPGRSEVLNGSIIEQPSENKEVQQSKIESKKLLVVSVDEASYSKRDTIKLQFSAASPSLLQIRSLSLSVIPENSYLSRDLLPQLKEASRDETKYYPETRSLSLSGKLTQSQSRIPVVGKRINLSIIGEGRDFMAVRTDSAGSFFFVLPDYYGSRDLFLCAEKSEFSDLKIWVDNDFCAMPVHLPSPAFMLSEQERITVQNMAINMQLNSYFNFDTLTEPPIAKNEEQAFYGKPDNIIYFDKFIPLPTLEEYFNELPGMVKIRKRNGVKYFKIAGLQDLSFFDPLVMVDWVAVDDPSKILAISPQNISRIEVINQAYVKGNQTYGGIISIISKKSDFGGIDLPSTGIFVNFRFLSDDQCYEISADTAANHPDSRNTLLWETNISLLNGKSKKYEIIAPDTPGRYSVVIEGISPEGEKISDIKVFEVVN